MVEIIIVVGVIVVLIAGLWWTRGAGGLPGGANDPARQQLLHFDQLGDPVSPPGTEHEDREHELE